MVPQLSLRLKQAEAFIPPSYFAFDPVANDYEAFFSVLDFEVVPERDESKPWPGNPPHPERAYVKAQLVMIREKIEYHTELRRPSVPGLVLNVLVYFLLGLVMLGKCSSPGDGPAHPGLCGGALQPARH